jgi:hypothetical protein
MREPVFNETMQLGIGPWRFDRIVLGDANNYREYGQPAEHSNRISIATVGRHEHK